MKIRLKRQHQTGLIWLVLFIYIPVALLAAYLIWKLLHWKPKYDPTHGIGDPDTNWSSEARSPAEYYGSNATIFVPEFNLSLPIEALGYEWSEVVEASTNLHDWTPVEMEWAEVLESVRTNQPLPQNFYRRLLVW